jgi:hypothetical protein
MRDSTAVLRAQLEVMRSSESNLLATVLWSLSFVGGVALILIGYNWFVAQRSFDRDRVSLRSEIKNELAAEFAALQDEIRVKTAELIGLLEATAQTAADKALAKALSKVTALEGQLQHAQQDLLKVEISVAQATKSEYQEFYGRLKLLGIYIETQSDFWIGNQLEGLAELIRGGFRPDADDAARISAALDKVPARFAVDVEGIRAQVRATRAT